MKCRPEDMLLFDLDYGDPIRPTFRILRGRWWGQFTNQTEDHLIVYGPKPERERSIFDTSPYVLPPGTTTPDSWDCKGFLLPFDRMLQRWRGRKHGPLAIKFWDFRRPTSIDAGQFPNKIGDLTFSGPLGLFNIGFTINSFIHR
jgi:hypothetical protein